MKLEDQVCSLELAKQLKELGIKQDSLFSWIVHEDEEHVELTKWARSQYGGIARKEKALFAAYTVAELGEALPEGFSSYRDAAFNEWRCESPWHGIKNMGRISKSAKTEANARAKMRIWLIENGLIEEKKAEKRGDAE